MQPLISTWVLYRSLSCCTQSRGWYPKEGLGFIYQVWIIISYSEGHFSDNNGYLSISLHIWLLNCSLNECLPLHWSRKTSQNKFTKWHGYSKQQGKRFLFSLKVTQKLHVIIHLSKPIECTPPRVSPNVNCGLWVFMMCPCRFVSCKKCAL